VAMLWGNSVRNRQNSRPKAAKSATLLRLGESPIYAGRKETLVPCKEEEP
jgi:hypothetical protein